MEKKKAIKIATATAIAASAFTAATVAPTQSEAATSITSQIKTAKAAIKKPYDTYIKATKTPANYTTVKNQLAAAKKAKTNINAAIKKAKLTTKQKNAYYAQVKAYDVYITRAQNYVNALSVSIAGAKAQLATAIASGTDADKLAKQAALKTKIAQFKTAVAKVYGKDTRSLLLSYYVTPAQKLVDSVQLSVTIESVSALNDTNQILQITFSNAVKSLNPTDIEIKDAKNGDLYGVQAVTLSSDGKTARVELFQGYVGNNDTAAQRVLKYVTDYTVTVNANGQKVSANFNRANFLDQRVVAINAKDHEFTIKNGSTSTGTETIKVLVDKPEFKDFNFEALKGEKVRVWYNKDNELIKYEIAKVETVTDAIEITKTNEIKVLSTGVKYDTSKEVFNTNNSATTKFAFYVNGKRVDVNGEIPKTYVDNANGTPAKFNYAKVGFDKSGKIEYVSAYNLKNFLVVDRVDGNSIVGVQGLGTGGDFDSQDAVIIKDGKSISRSDLKKGDVVFFYNYDSGSQSKKDRFAVVVNKTVTGKIDSVFDSSVTIAGKTYDFAYDQTIKDRFQFDYGKAVYVKDTGKTDVIDSDAAKSLQAGGTVTAYLDLAGNLVYVSGATSTVVSNSTVGIMTDAIVGDNSFGKDSIQVDTVLPNGNETIKNVSLDNLDKIKIDGVEYKIDNSNPAAGKYVAKLISRTTANNAYNTAAYQTLGLFKNEAAANAWATGNPDYTDATGIHTVASALVGTPINLTTTEGKVVKVALDNNNNINRLEFFTNHVNTAKSPLDATKLLDQGVGNIIVNPDATLGETTADTAGAQLKAGDKYAVTSNGSKLLLDSTPVFDAKDGYKKGFDVKDITATTWGKYNGSDINRAQAVYNEDNEVVALVILESASNTKKYEEIVVTNVLRNTDGDVVSVEGYVNGTKQTLNVDKITAASLVKGSTAVLQFDDNTSKLVKDIYTTGHDVDGQYVNRTAGLTNLTIKKVDVGNRTVTFTRSGSTTEETYKFAADGAVLDGKDATDIQLKSLTDLRDRTGVTAVLDENDANGFVKYFIYGAGSTLPTANVAPTATLAPATATNDSATLEVTFSEPLYVGSSLITNGLNVANLFTATGLNITSAIYNTVANKGIVEFHFATTGDSAAVVEIGDSFTVKANALKDSDGASYSPETILFNGSAWAKN